MINCHQKHSKNSTSTCHLYHMNLINEFCYSNESSHMFNHAHNLELLSILDKVLL